MQGFQFVHVPLPSLSVNLSSANQRSAVRLRELMQEILGRIAHVVAFHLEVDLDPSYTTAPTVVGHNALFNRIEFFDGSQVRFQGSGNDLRFFERLENGKVLTAEALTNGGTGNNRYFSRTLYMGPPRMAGHPTDFAFPCAALENGELRITWGTLTDISADCTAATAVVYVTAICVLMDEIRIPPFYERQVYNLTGKDTPIPGKCLAAYLSLANSTSYDAFAAGDLGQVNVGTGQGDVVPGVDAATLWKLHNIEMEVGDVGGISGDPRNATYDVNNRIVNGGTPTALAAQALDQSPVLWVPPGGRITKIAAFVDSSLRLRWAGNNGSGTLAHFGRFLEQSESQLATIGERAARRLNKKGKLDVKLLQGGRFGPYLPFLPFVYK